MPVRGASEYGTFSPDELSLYFAGPGNVLRVATRASLSAPFGASKPLANIEPPALSPWISSDGLTVFFESYERCDAGCGRVSFATRLRTIDEFTRPSLVPVINQGAIDTGTSIRDPALSGDGQALYFAWSGGSGAHNHIWRSGRPSGTWSAPERVSEIIMASSCGEGAPVPSADNRALYFGARVPDCVTVDVRLFVARRRSVGDPFGPPTEVSGFVNYAPVWVSPDECRLYMYSDQGFYVVERAK